MRKVFVTLVLSVLLAGCDRNVSAPSPDKAPIASAPAAADSSLNFKATADGKIILKWNTRDLYEKLGLAPQSGAKLRAYSPDQFPRVSPDVTYAFHSKPGEDQGMYFQRFPADGAIRATLTRVDADFRPIDDNPLVSTVTHDPRSAKDVVHKFPFRVHVPLPSDVDALYAMRTELVEKDGTVSDSVINVFYVPGKAVNATLATDKETYAPGDTLLLRLTNGGPTNLGLGSMYLLEKKADDGWTKLNAEANWTLEGYTSTPENDFTQKIKLDGLSVGTYRISKSVGAENADFGVTLSDTFEIKG
ncbi:immunoglobulin-like domain-containing protein [Cohnella suwonensis]|uniref:Immunoglobulin-like domain-containing protein n=1 Tax=Cohnella suwonensis TaxID=696072 RepID=A0ABW0LTE7_9BACL